MAFGDCFKQKNKAVTGEVQPPAHPSNDTTPVTQEAPPIFRENFFEKYAFAKTCAFEGSGIGQVSDNFDGQGISLGGLQWCVGQGSLQERILKPYFKDNKPDGYVEMILEKISLVSIKEGLKLCKEHFLVGTKLKPEVRRELEKFAIRAEKFQMLAADVLFDKAWGMCKTSKLTSLKAFCFFFDICVQNGSLNGIPKPSYDSEKYLKFIESEGAINKKLWLEANLNKDEETVILSLWINARAKQNKWRSDVIARKCTIAHGVGYVHGVLHTFPEFKLE